MPRERKPRVENLDDPPKAVDKSAVPEKPAAPPKAPRPAKPPVQGVSSRQFVAARAFKAHRCAGFLHWADRKYGRRHRLPISEWLPLWQEFWATPVK